MELQSDTTGYQTRLTHIFQLQNSIAMLRNILVCDIDCLQVLSARLTFMSGAATTLWSSYNSHIQSVASAGIQKDSVGAYGSLDKPSHADALCLRIERKHSLLAAVNSAISIIGVPKQSSRRLYNKRLVAGRMQADFDFVIASSILEIALSAEDTSNWCRGFKSFWSESIRDGWLSMIQASSLASNFQTDTGEPGSCFAHLSKATTFTVQAMTSLETLSSVLRTVTTLPEIADELDQIDAMKKAIETMYYLRFAFSELSLYLKTTVTFYRNLEVLLSSVIAMDDVSSGKETKMATLRKLTQSIVNIYEDDLERITDRAIWALCDVYDSTGPQRETFESTENPSKENVRPWLRQQASNAMSENSMHTQYERAEAIENAFLFARQNANKYGLPLLL